MRWETDPRTLRVSVRAVAISGEDRTSRACVIIFRVGNF
jgi:hypothetical protein